MSIAFAQQTELSRVSEGVENGTASEQAHAPCQQEEQHFQEKQLPKGQAVLQALEGTDTKLKEEFKPLSKELGEDRKEVLLSNDEDLAHTLDSEDHELTISEEMFSKDKTFVVRESVSTLPQIYIF